ncbi:MAG TPA: hypothetical protein VES19_07740 [Candidatus Limnocylindrales bacterium]|nr:hypothetical protein [Candidatus Limnocylindrales bacterium]
MTDQNPNEPPNGGSTPDPEQPAWGTPPAGEADPGAAGSARSREWVAQLEAMIAQISTQAAPVARQVGAKAAELAAIAAVKAGPVAHKAADLTTDYGQRFAEKAQSVAAELRSHDGATADGPAPADAAPDGAPEATPAEEPAPEDTAGTGL